MQIPLIGNLTGKKSQAEKDKSGQKPWAIVLVAAVLIGSGVTAARIFSNPNSEVAIADLTVPVQSQALSVKIRSSGTVVPIKTVNLSPKVTGRLTELYVEQGDRVSKGQLIAKMDDSNIVPQVLQAKASLANAEANLEKLRNGSRQEDIDAAIARVDAARERMELSSAKVDRNRSLVAEGVINRDRFDEIKTDYQTSLASLREQQRQLELLRNGSRYEDIAIAEAQVEQARASLRNVEAQLDDTLITAPFAGIITQKFTNEGAIVTPTTSASTTSSATSSSIVAIASELEVLAKVPEIDISQIKIDQEVEILADAYPDQVFTGRVRLIAPEAVIEQNVTSFEVRIAIESGQEELQSGMNVDAVFIGERLADTLVVPTVAIVTEKGQTGLLLPADRNRVEFQPVTIGISVDNQTQILDGIEAGTEVYIELPEAEKRRRQFEQN
ncbi:efflux transporter, RND family, MFP subunit [Thalassoporum mexicanum PCC 7367]|uniref:efflux RND transporter periplasmic adaptor subunit n=1 Tax=Thalassoporum mexicanum TaxID=3457544 RepID=UPI00029F860D|nr:efflux RND transporter periplasmic adaptor subunit [Pseudanabaena sp. PCC 7367]AFY71760.1 efflux transporter, RND family, MFP subunit [Pseudanabaena sp. PCC 7367]